MPRQILGFSLAAAMALTTLAMGSAGRANDSTAELAAGGLVLKHDPAIEMKSEDLFISAKLVRVRYRFLNTSAKDVTVLVAFPMPDITMTGEDDTLSIPTQNAHNILGFHTTINGKPVTAQVQQTVTAKGVDQTAFLRSLHVPLAPHLETTDKVLDGLPQAQKDEIIARGLGRMDEYDIGHGMEKHLIATWTLKTTYYWSQTFPAGRELLVEHRYTPSVGESAGSFWDAVNVAKDPDFAARRQHYCVDDGFLASIARARKPAEDYAPFNEQRIEYILSTGANWKAPIGDFRMVVDKGDARNLISFCAEGLRKTGPTTFEMHQTNFTPTREVSILILQPTPRN